MQKSNIEWCTHTWNPVSGCSKVSSGCKNCYAERHAKRFWGERKFTDVRMHTEKLGEPLRRKKPSVIFVASMSDLFHLSIPREFVDCVFLRMLRTPQHIYLVLTKRPERAAAHFQAMNKIQGARGERGLGIPPNVWIGVSVEDQESADERIPTLFELPTQNLFVSAEPLLAPVDISQYLDQLKWVIVGGESGPNARPMHPDWARSIRDQCKSAKVPFFFKQNGEWLPSLDVPSSHADTYSYKTRGSRNRSEILDGELMVKVGKKPAGRLLDGREHLEFPEAIAKIKGDYNDRKNAR